MKVLALLAALWLAVATTAWAYNPVPLKKSAVETELSAALEQAHSDSAKLKIAEDALNARPDDVAMARIAQDVIMKFKTDPVDYFKNRAETSQSVAAHYLYGWAEEDRKIKTREAAWILKKEPHNFWGHMLAADAEWAKDKPNYTILRKQISDAIAADPSRPEGYLSMGFAFEDEEKWPEARQAFEAGAVCDPASMAIRDQRLTAYAQLHDGKAYFDLAQSIFSDKPLQMDLPRASGTGNVTTANLLGKNTVVEYWAFT